MKPIWHLVIVAGHAIFQHRRWHGGYPGEDHFYEQHIDAGLNLASQLPSSCIALTGGYTRPNLPEVKSGEVTNSEADGMLENARIRHPEHELDNVLVERFARDSFENIFFALLAGFQRFGTWPASVHVVSWPFKANRFYLIGCGLRLAEGRFFFHGVGDQTSQEALETVTMANVGYEKLIVRDRAIVDPLHRDPEFAEKRAKRTAATYGSTDRYIEAVKSAYDREVHSLGAVKHPVSAIVDTVEALSPGPEWRSVQWPW